MSHKCPDCKSSRVYQETRRVRQLDVKGWVWAGWTACLVCWRKFNGIREDGGKLDMPGVTVRKARRK